VTSFQHSLTYPSVPPPLSLLPQEIADKAAGVLAKGAKKDTDLYAAYRVNVTKAAIATEYDKKRRTLVVRSAPPSLPPYPSL